LVSGGRGSSSRHLDRLQATAPCFYHHALGKVERAASRYPTPDGVTGRTGDHVCNRYGSGFGSGYQDRINNEQFAFPVDAEKLDGRLTAGEIVLTVEIDEEAKAFPLGVIGDSAVNSEVGSEPIVVFTASRGRSVAAFSRAVNGDILTFSRQDDDLFIDNETGSAWDFAGRAVDGPLAGVHLNRVSSRRAFWFSVAITFPGIEIHNP